MIKGFRVIALLTVVSRVFGMLRDMAFAYFLGAGLMMDVWVIAFKIPNLARRIFGEGAATSSFIPVYSETLKTDRAAALRLAHTVVTVIAALLTGVVLVGLGILWYIHRYHAPLESTRLMLTLAALMLPYMTMICIEAILGGILNTHRHFAAPAAAPIVLNLINIGSLCLGNALGLTIEQQLFLLAFGVLLTGVLQVGLQVVPMRGLGLTLRPAWDVYSDGFKQILWLMGPMILGMAVTQINTLADDVIAKSLSGSLEPGGKGEFFTFWGRQIRYPVMDGAVSSLFYTQRLYQFPLGVLGISLATAIFPVLSDAAAEKNAAKLSEITLQGFQGALFLALPSTAGLILVARPLIAALFERGKFTPADTELGVGVLICYALGLSGFFIQQILPRTFYAMKESKIPARTAAAAVLLNVILNLTLIWPMGAAGLALSTSLCSYVQIGIMLWLLRRRMPLGGANGFWPVFGKTVVGTALISLVGGITLAAMRPLPHTTAGDAIRLLVMVTICAGAYLLTARWLKNPMLGLILSAKAAKRR